MSAQELAQQFGRREHEVIASGAGAAEAIGELAVEALRAFREWATAT